MNPWKWKREHRIALYLAAALGGFVGALVCYLHLGLLFGVCGTFRNPILGCLFDHYALVLAFWVGAGMVVGGGIVYVRQLLLR
jgi:hypothetical protein